MVFTIFLGFQGVTSIIKFLQFCSMAISFIIGQLLTYSSKTFQDELIFSNWDTCLTVTEQKKNRYLFLFHFECTYCYLPISGSISVNVVISDVIIVTTNTLLLKIKRERNGPYVVIPNMSLHPWVIYAGTLSICKAIQNISKRLNNNL